MATFLGQDLGAATYLFKELDMGEKQKFQDKRGSAIQSPGGIRAYDITDKSCVVKVLAWMFNHTVNVDGKIYLVGDKSCKNFFDRNVGFAHKNEKLQSALNRIEKIQTLLSPNVKVSKNDLKEVLENIGVQNKDEVITKQFKEFIQEDGSYKFNKDQFFGILDSTEIKAENPLGKAVISHRKDKNFEGMETIFKGAVDGPAPKPATVTPQNVKEPEPARQPQKAGEPKPAATNLKAILGRPTQVQTPKPAEKKEAGGVIVPAGREPAFQPLSKQQPAKSVTSSHLAIEGSPQQIPTGEKKPVRLPIGGGASVVHEVPEEISTQKQAPNVHGAAKAKPSNPLNELAMTLVTSGWDDVKGSFDKLSILDKAKVILTAGQNRGKGDLGRVESDLTRAMGRLVAHSATAEILKHETQDLLALKSLMDGDLGKITISYEKDRPTTLAKDFTDKVDQYKEGVSKQFTAPVGVQSPIEDSVATLALNAKEFGFFAQVKETLDTLLFDGKSDKSVDELVLGMKKLPDEEIETDEDRATRVKDSLSPADGKLYDAVSNWEGKRGRGKGIEYNLGSLLALPSVDANSLKRLFKADPDLSADLLLEMGVEDPEDMSSFEIAIGKQENSKALREALLGEIIEKLEKPNTTQVSKASEETNMDMLVNAYADYQEQLSAEKNAALLADRKAHSKQARGPQPTEEDWAELADEYQAKAAQMEAKDKAAERLPLLGAPGWMTDEGIPKIAQNKLDEDFQTVLRDSKSEKFSISAEEGEKLCAVVYGCNKQITKARKKQLSSEAQELRRNLHKLPLFQQYLLYDIAGSEDGGVKTRKDTKDNLLESLAKSCCAKGFDDPECVQLREFLEGRKSLVSDEYYTRIMSRIGGRK